MYKRNFIQSFFYAVRGITFIFKTERNMRVHCVVAVLVIMAAVLLKVTPTELIIIFFSIGLVLVAETANTAFELLLDYINGSKYHTTVKMLKDIAAGGVLIASLNAVVIGAIIFWPKINLFMKY